MMVAVIIVHQGYGVLTHGYMYDVIAVIAANCTMVTSCYPIIAGFSCEFKLSHIGMI